MISIVPCSAQLGEKEFWFAQGERTIEDRFVPKQYAFGIHGIVPLSRTIYDMSFVLARDQTSVLLTGERPDEVRLIRENDYHTIRLGF